MGGWIWLVTLNIPDCSKKSAKQVKRQTIGNGNKKQFIPRDVIMLHVYHDD